MLVAQVRPGNPPVFLHANLGADANAQVAGSEVRMFPG